MTLKPVINWSVDNWKDYLKQTNRSFGDLEIITKAGEGNMNLVLRLHFSDNTIIAKHSPPFCVKFPHIPAPIERLNSEMDFFELASLHPQIKKMLPSIIDFDSELNIVLMEDLGECQDYGHLYKNANQMKEEDFKPLVSFLSQLHSLDTGNREFKNSKMRKLNHDYIFILPYSDLEFEIQEYFGPFTPKAHQIRIDPLVAQRTKLLGEKYLEDGKVLNHGDFYPLSWLKTKQGPKIIDPEFAFKGRPEFDVGVLIAHLKLSNMPNSSIKDILKDYKNPTIFNKDISVSFAGCEMARRLLYVSQLPLFLDYQQKIHLLLEAREMILNPSTFWQIL